MAFCPYPPVFARVGLKYIFYVILMLPYFTSLSYPESQNTTSAVELAAIFKVPILNQLG